jgi:hypothetical protein
MMVSSFSYLNIIGLGVASNCNGLEIARLMYAILLSFCIHVPAHVPLIPSCPGRL